MNEPKDRREMLAAMYSFTKIDANTIRFPTPHMGGAFKTGRLFGGQAAGQAIRATQQIFGDTVTPASLQYKFCAPGKVDLPLNYEVSKIGEDYCRVIVKQGEKIIGSAQCLISDDLLPSFPLDLTYIENEKDVPLLSEFICGNITDQKSRKLEWLLDNIIYEVKLVEWSRLVRGEDGVARNTIWARIQPDCREVVPSTCGLQAVVTLSDYFIIQIAELHNSLRKVCKVTVGVSVGMDELLKKGFRIEAAASLHHTVHFHKKNEELNAHDWFLLRTEMVSFSFNRAKIVAFVYDSKRECVASIIQEAYCKIYPKLNKSKL